MQKRGLAYEKKILKLLRNNFKIIEQPWICYDDTRYCQPDAIVLDDANNAVVVEIKLSYRDEAKEKLQLLYGPLCAEILGRNIYHAQITRTIPPDFEEPLFDLEDLLSVKKNYFVIHSTGR